MLRPMRTLRGCFTRRVRGGHGTPLGRRLARAGAGLVAATALAPVVSAALAQPAWATANAVVPDASIGSFSPTQIPANDDGSTGSCISLGFNINFYGVNYGCAWVNNNGNLTFDGPLTTFTPFGLASNATPIIAPFFADVDTAVAGSNLVEYGTGTLDGHTVFVANWPGVDCYVTTGGGLDNFQVILIDRPDLGTGANGDDFQIEFNYDSIQWDAGQASGGDANCTNATNSSSAVVGFSNGTTTAADTYQLPGSQTTGAFLDSNMTTGLINNDMNSTVLGRYLFGVNGGTPVVGDPSTLAVQSASGDFNDPTSVSATLTDTTSSAAIQGATVDFTLNGTETCSGTTDVNGVASCSVTPGEAAGPYTLGASYAGDSAHNGTTGSNTFTMNTEETALSYTGDTSAVNGQPMTLSGVLTTDDPAAGTAVAGRTVDFTLGSGGTAQTCSGTTDVNGLASCTVATVNQAVGTVPVSDSFAGDTYFQPASNSASTVSVFNPTATGAFVVGDTSAASGHPVYFWGSQWSTMNVLSGGSAPSSMKGFADSPTSLTCGATWTTSTGNSSAPPSSLPSTIDVIVSSRVTQHGSVLSGRILHIVEVQVNSGYGPNPGHPGTGTIVGTVC